jgi:hypothetical protein
MLIDIPTTSNARASSLHAASHQLLPKRPRDDGESTSGSFLSRMPETNSTTITTQDFEPIKHMLIDQARQHKADVYWKYSLVPWMALNVVNNLRLNNPNDGPTGTLRTACNMPYRFRFPKIEVPIGGRRAITVSPSAVSPTWSPRTRIREPTFNARFNVVQTHRSHNRREPAEPRPPYPWPLQCC